MWRKSQPLNPICYIKLVHQFQSVKVKMVPRELQDHTYFRTKRLQLQTELTPWCQRGKRSRTGEEAHPLLLVSSWSALPATGPPQEHAPQWVLSHPAHFPSLTETLWERKNNSQIILFWQIFRPVMHLKSQVPHTRVESCCIPHSFL